MIHHLKTWSEYYYSVGNGSKTFEVRKNDRNYKVGDILILKNWDNEKQRFFVGEITVEVTYILQGGNFGIQEGYCVMGIKRL